MMDILDIFLEKSFFFLLFPNTSSASLDKSTKERQSFGFRGSSIDLQGFPTSIYRPGKTNNHRKMFRYELSF